MVEKEQIMETAQNYITAVVANSSGEIFDLEGYAAIGMSGIQLELLTEGSTIDMPHGSELMLLPDRIPLLYNIASESFELVEENPYSPGEAIYPVAVFNSPGYVNAHVCAYEEEENAGYLPLFSYGAVGWNTNGFVSSAIHVDKERRQDLRLMPEDKINRGVLEKKQNYPGNRLRQHLEKCALTYGCPAAKNFFIGRCEAPLPTSQHCNARCLGCISLQKTEQISCCQERIAFTPSAGEIAEIALDHIYKVKQGIVSFGQGCEGDPLLAADVIEPAIKQIRAETDQGTVNMNTNGSLPKIATRLFDAGLDSIRISMNSVRKECYNTYFRPVGYRFEDVLETIRIAGDKGIFISINYLNCPGVTDSPEEMETMEKFLDTYPVNFIQWRNLNYDPLRYYQVMESAESQGEPVGMDTVLDRLRKQFPELKHGYFNPAKEIF